jgi:hypothetical protein
LPKVIYGRAFVQLLARAKFKDPVHTGGNRNAATLLLVFLDFYCHCVDGRDTLFPIFKQHGRKIKHVRFFARVARVSSNSIAGCVDASVTANAEERATAHQRAAFCFGLVLAIIFGIISLILDCLAVKIAEDEIVTVSLK